MCAIHLSAIMLEPDNLLVEQAFPLLFTVERHEGIDQEEIEPANSLLAFSWSKVSCLVSYFSTALSSLGGGRGGTKTWE